MTAAQLLPPSFFSQAQHRWPPVIASSLQVRLQRRQGKGSICAAGRNAELASQEGSPQVAPLYPQGERDEQGGRPRELPDGGGGRRREAHLAVLPLRGDLPRHGGIPSREHGGEGRLRGSVQGGPPRWAEGRREEAGAGLHGGEEGEGVLDGARHGRPCPPPQRLISPRLLRRPRPLPRLRVLPHRLPLLSPPRRAVAAGGLEAPAEDRRGDGEGAPLPPQGLPEEDHPQGREGVQHSPDRRLRTSDLRLRAGEMAPVGVDPPRRRFHRGDLRVPRAGVLHAWRGGREDGRLRLRRPPPGDHLREEARRRVPPQPAQLGPTPPARRRREEAGGPGAGRRLRRRPAREDGLRRRPLHQSGGNLAALHGRGGGAAGGRGDLSGDVEGGGGRGRGAVLGLGRLGRPGRERLAPLLPVLPGQLLTRLPIGPDLCPSKIRTRDLGGSDRGRSPVYESQRLACCNKMVPLMPPPIVGAISTRKIINKSAPI